MGECCPHVLVSPPSPSDREDRVWWCRAGGDRGASRALSQQLGGWDSTPRLLGLLLYSPFPWMGFDFLGSHFISPLTPAARSQRPLRPQGKPSLKLFLGKAEFKTLPGEQPGDAGGHRVLVLCPANLADLWVFLPICHGCSLFLSLLSWGGWMRKEGVG